MTLKRLPAALTAIALAAASVVLHAEELPPALQALQKQGITIARPKPLADSSLQPLAPIPPVVATQLDANAKLMMSWACKLPRVWSGEMPRAPSRSEPEPLNRL